MNEISQILEQKIATTRTQLRHGQIPGAVKIGKSWRISRALFEEFVRERAPR
ncbi:MAG: DNA-binding protein [Sulfobacillus benefaciens]|uniref:DNA-binding protein n=1 Tax=Sulfobacillus benefaciens TaxID=453960 RepID=A0A2T2WM48_9FIRM|nr:MAG: DNA-binding protein [Sulfobacillus benefaciens]